MDLLRVESRRPPATTHVKTNLRRADVPRKLLVRQNHARLFRCALEDWALILAFWLAMSVSPLWIMPLWIFLVGNRIHALAATFHEHVHLFDGRETWKDRVLEILTAYPVAQTLRLNRYHHLQHHRDTGSASDPYFVASRTQHPIVQFLTLVGVGLALVPLYLIHAPFGVLALVVPKLRTPYGRLFLMDRSGKDLSKNRDVIACTQADVRILFFHAALLGATILYPRALLLGYFLPVGVLSMLNVYRLYLEHPYGIRVTADHSLDPIRMFLFGPRNIGYHVAHHLHPQVSSDHLPALTQWYRQNDQGF
jgi:fatty acid desaturase